MLYQILNGDSLAYSFPATNIEGELVVMREALIDGDLSGDDLPAFWRSRAAALGVSPTEYQHTVVNEIDKILQAADEAVFNLWFEYDLFCQVNSWFILSLINSLPIRKTVYIVHTAHLNKTDKHFWNGFGPANTAELLFCYDRKIALSDADLQLGKDLWSAYKQRDLQSLANLSQQPSLAFPYLQEVVAAHMDRFPVDGTPGRPERVIEDILANGSTDFEEVCSAFWNSQSIYGFGDTQVKSIYDKVMRGR